MGPQGGVANAQGCTDNTAARLQKNNGSEDLTFGEHGPAAARGFWQGGTEVGVRELCAGIQRYGP